MKGSMTKIKNSNKILANRMEQVENWVSGIKDKVEELDQKQRKNTTKI
jgi:vacuolar-type H+-ATPase subunit E/Vma4